ncbi:hypothetical protein ACHAQA_002409 [Verticillium albo-atrum]
MPIQVVIGTPLADALNEAIQGKLIEVSLAQSTNDAAALSEYIVLTLVNGKSQEEIVNELATDLLGLPANDPVAIQFVAWMFEQVDTLNNQLSAAQPSQSAPEMNFGAQDESANAEMDTDMNASEASELNAPTGPRSMRNGNNLRGGREKRMLGKALDRTGDSVLHRTRGNDRINSHARGPPTGPRGNMRGGGRGMNARAANIQAGMNAMGGMNMRANGPPGMGGMNGGWGAPQGGEMDLMAMMQQQSQMMAQLQQQIMNGGPNNGMGQQRHGKSLFERTQQPHRNNNRNRQHQNKPEGEGEAGAEGEDVDMAKREPPNPEDTVCKFNLRCTNRDCKFGHQSPAAPPGAHVDMNDICTFGAACKNRKCVGRHPSPATKLAHQGEQDCKFFPNCHNPQCPFKHPDMPLCRNGSGCTTPGCKFTHVKVKCRFNPCKNPHCAYSHDEGQQGGFKDKVWTPEGGEHVSERKFVVEGDGEDVMIPEDSAMGQEDNAVKQELIT